MAKKPMMPMMKKGKGPAAKLGPTKPPQSAKKMTMPMPAVGKKKPFGR